MPNILETIIERKRKGLEEVKKNKPLKNLIAQCKKINQTESLLKYISVPDELSIIAEMKKSSPSAGQIIKKYDPAQIAKMYEKSGARAISILTEENYFLGRTEHISTVKKATSLPILRKDFIFDPYQIYESKVLGASAILLIVAILSKNKITELFRLAESLKIDTLVEVHSERELEIALSQRPKLIGINNRNLKDLSINIDTTFKLMKHIPKDICVVAESGIQSPETIHQLKSVGVQAALIGESILRSKNIKKKIRSFVEAGQN